ncbi:kelch repeat and BTB domain-containing protein 8-like isoform X2 [Branchiostoma lanceolatum]
MFIGSYAEAKQERIRIQDVSGVAMATILDYAYTGRLQMEPDQVQAVMTAAGLFQVGFICCKAAEYMKDHLDVSNCADVLMYADMLGDSALVEASGRYIASRFSQMVLQPSFLQLPLPLLQSLLNRDDLMTNFEYDIVQGALRWIDFDKERLRHFPVFCSSFRRSFISEKLRMELESKYSTTDYKLVYSDSTVKRLGQTRTRMQIFVTDNYIAPCYDPSSRKLYKMKLPEGVSNFSITVTRDDEIYLAGHTKGFRNGLRIDTQKAFYQYNHLLNTWESRSQMISPRNSCALVCLKGFIYAIGGDSENTAERYDPSCDEWTSIAPLPSAAMLSPCAVPLDDSIYVIKGKSCYCFSTTEDTWRIVADTLPTPLHEQVVEYAGCIYRVCGGHVASSVQIYSPEDGIWKSTGNCKSFPCDYAMLTVYKRPYSRKGMVVDVLYLITVRSKADPDDDPWESLGRRWPRIDLYEYQNWKDSWCKQDSRDKMVPPISQWLEARRLTECLLARMVPTSLEDGSSYKDEQEHSDHMYGSDYMYGYHSPPHPYVGTGE